MCAYVGYSAIHEAIKADCSMSKLALNMPYPLSVDEASRHFSYSDRLPLVSYLNILSGLQSPIKDEE